MKKVNNRNNNGVKSSHNMYRTINGVEFEHWTSSSEKTIKEWKLEFPGYEFIRRGCEIFRSHKKS